MNDPFVDANSEKCKLTGFSSDLLMSLIRKLKSGSVTKIELLLFRSRFLSDNRASGWPRCDLTKKDVCEGVSRLFANRFLIRRQESAIVKLLLLLLLLLL